MDTRLMNLWEEVVQVASCIVLNEEEDNLVWQLSSNVVYSSQSLYVVINFSGVMPTFIPAVWKLQVPQSTFLSLVTLKKQTSD